jgi:proline racemase
VARGDLRLGEPLVHESSTGELFTSLPVESVQVGNLAGVRIRITGTA